MLDTAVFNTYTLYSKLEVINIFPASSYSPSLPVFLHHEN